ncbi:MAG: SDR family oxidoreductase [Proteobacteria bacterium]|nr:SDR family oxidoreductase [Pseudomonadota bacterium]
MSDPFAAFRLAGRTALVTGARREIGRAIALGLAGAGARLAIHHVGTPEETEDAAHVVREIEAQGGIAAAFAQDFVLDDAGHALAAAVTAWAPVDILVLNASIELPEDFATITRERFDRQIAVNLRTTMELLQDLVPLMAQRGWGRVVTIGSVQQERPHPAMLVYAGSKAAQLNWSRSLARQYGGSGVTVNNLAPGAILTARNKVQMQTEAEGLIQRIPAGRLGTPDDLVGAAMLLCSDAGRYINGVNLYVDGGRTAV